MIKALVIVIGSFLFQGLVLQQAMRALSADVHRRRSRMTYGNALWTVLGLGALSAIIGGLGYLGLGVIVAGWLAYLAIHMAIFSGYFGFAPQVALLLLPVIWLARVVFEGALRILPFFG